MSLLIALVGTSVVLAGSLEQDSLPLPAYLQKRDVLEAVHALTPVLEPCFEASPPEEPWAAVIRFSVASDGTVPEVQVEDGEAVAPERRRCIEAAYRSLAFPAHAEASETYRYRLVYRHGRVPPYPDIEHLERTAEPLFVRFPPCLPAPDRQHLRERFGMEIRSCGSSASPAPSDPPSR